jgi:predicted Zn-dependent protease
MSLPWRFILVLALLVACGAAVYLGSVEQPVDFSSVLEIWGDVLRDADQFGLQLTRASDDEEMRLGRDLAANVTGWWRETQDRQPYVSEVGESLLPGLRRKGIRYQFHVLDAAAPNAFSLPGGQVFITTGMFGFLQSEAELASVLGHEMSHVDLRHSIERYQYLLKARKIHAAPVGQLAEIARSLVTVQYAKYQELDADAQGVRLSIEAGYDPQAAVDAFTRLASQLGESQPPDARTPTDEVATALGGALSSYFQSHPPSAWRAARVRETMARNRGRLRGRTFYRGVENYRRRIPKSQQTFSGETTSVARGPRYTSKTPQASLPARFQTSG